MLQYLYAVVLKIFHTQSTNHMDIVKQEMNILRKIKALNYQLEHPASLAMYLIQLEHAICPLTQGLTIRISEEFSVFNMMKY